MAHTHLVEVDVIPLHQNVEQSQRILDTAFEVGLFAMYHFLEMTYQGQHRQCHLDHHTVISFATLTQARIVGMPIDLGEACVGKDNHLI